MMEEINVKSVSEFVQNIVNINQEFYHPVADLRTLYRGHADKTWEALPSTFRNYDDFLNEGLYLREFQRELPNECNGLSYFDILVKAQHYGIPTRLLDFTLNPLIALYFACEKLHDTDGKVLVFQNCPVFQRKDISIKVLTHYIFKYKNGLDWTDDMRKRLYESVKQDDDYYYTISENLIEKILNSNHFSIFVFPRLSNDRIRAQQGAFAIFNTKYKIEGKTKKFLVPSNDMALKPTKVIYIPSTKKKQILKELDLLGINKSSLFPELEPHAEDIVRRVRNTNREFRLQMQLKR